MQNHLIEFDKMNWVYTSVGIRYKAFVSGNQRIRLVEFSKGFIEPDWCQNGHAGYIIDGEFTLDFNGKLEYLKKGDMFFIPIGEADKHKAVLKKGEQVLILLFEILL